MKTMDILQKSLRNACRLGVGAMLCCSVFEASAADWTSISKAKDSETLVDMDSYNELDGLPYITTKTIFLTLQNYGKNALKFSYTERHTTQQFNCDLHTLKNISTQFYTANKKLVATVKGVNAFNPIAAGSPDAALASLVCQVHKMVGGN